MERKEKVEWTYQIRSGWGEQWTSATPGVGEMERLYLVAEDIRG